MGNTKSKKTTNTIAAETNNDRADQAANPPLAASAKKVHMAYQGTPELKQKLKLFGQRTAKLLGVKEIDRSTLLNSATLFMLRQPIGTVPMFAVAGNKITASNNVGKAAIAGKKPPKGIKAQKTMAAGQSLPQQEIR